jgi:beta-lactamase class A
MHDGCLTLERYKVAIIGELKRLLREHTGYAVRVEEKQIASPRVMEWEAKTGFDLASTDTLAEMTNALNDFKRQYEPLQKRANKEARRNHSPNQAKQTKRQTRVDYILHGPSPTWQVWRECHKAMNALEQEYNQPIRYFAERKQLTTKRRMRV